MDRLASISLFTALVGLLDSVYLTWIKLSHTEVSCAGGLGDCYTVNMSRYAVIYGIPIALLGLIAYLLIAGLLFFETRNDFVKENGPLAVFGISLVGFLYSIYLTYLEVAVIRAWCPYCVLSAITITLIFSLSLIRVTRSQPEKL
jgi:uncharacterized membrane protein